MPLDPQRVREIAAALVAEHGVSRAETMAREIFTAPDLREAASVELTAEDAREIRFAALEMLGFIRQHKTGLRGDPMVRGGA